MSKREVAVVIFVVAAGACISPAIAEYNVVLRQHDEYRISAEGFGIDCDEWEVTSFWACAWADVLGVKCNNTIMGPFTETACGDYAVWASQMIGPSLPPWDQCEHDLRCYAFVGVPCEDEYLFEMSRDQFIGGDFCYSDDVCSSAWACYGGFAMFDMMPRAERDTPPPWTVRLTGTITDPGIAAGYVGQLTRVVASMDRTNIGANPAYAMYASGQAVVSGMTADVINSQWLIDVSESGGAGTHYFEPADYRFTDYDFDVSRRRDLVGSYGFYDDGRFNYRDVMALEYLAGRDVEEDEDLRRWDFNGNGEIDDVPQDYNGVEVPSDVSYLQVLVDAGFDSGVFGDVTGDDLVDCQRRAQIAGMFGYTLGQTGYNVVLDYDLDGDTDNDDQNVFMTETCPWALGDANCDGTIDFGDVNAFIDAVAGWSQYYTNYPTCVWLNADMNCDYTVDFADINRFVDCIIHGLCSCP